MSLDHEMTAERIKEQALSMKDEVQNLIQPNLDQNLVNTETYTRVISNLRYQVLAEDSQSSQAIATSLSSWCQKGLVSDESNQCALWTQIMRDPDSFIRMIREYYLHIQSAPFKEELAKFSKHYADRISAYNFSERNYGMRSKNTLALSVELDEAVQNYRSLLSSCTEKLLSHHRASLFTLKSPPSSF
jgi:hypothetical protein